MGSELENDKKGVYPNQKIKIGYTCTIDMTLRYLLLNQMRSLQDSGFEVCGVSSPGGDVPFIESSGVKHISVPMTRKSFTPIKDLISLWGLWKIFRKEGFTIVHTHTPKAGIYGRLAAKAAGVPIIIHTHHGFPFHKKSVLGKLFKILERMVSKYSDLIFSVNQEDMESGIKKGIWPPAKVKACGSGGIGIDLARFYPDFINRQNLIAKRAEIGIKNGSKVVGFVGRVVRDKGLLDLFEAAQKVSNSIPNVTFLIIGGADDARKDAVNQDVVRKYKVANFCHFLGLRHDMPDMYGLMDVLVLPSHREGFPLVLAEASSMAVPVIATDITGCREAVEDGRNGLLVPLGNIPALANAIIEVLSNQEKAKKMGKEGRQMALELFDERIVFEKVEIEYVRLLNEKGLLPSRGKSICPELSI